MTPGKKHRNRAATEEKIQFLSRSTPPPRTYRKLTIGNLPEDPEIPDLGRHQAIGPRVLANSRGQGVEHWLSPHAVAQKPVESGHLETNSAVSRFVLLKGIEPPLAVGPLVVRALGF